MQRHFKRKWHSLFFLDYKIFVKKNPILDICPNCNSMASLERLLQKSRIHKIPRFFGFKKYHCTVCKWEGYIYLYIRRTDSMKRVLLNYLFALFSLYVLYLILLHFFDDIMAALYN
jgi:hypothetical protein